MRAWQVSDQGEPRDVLTLVEVEPPEIPAGMIRLDVAAAAIVRWWPAGG